MMVNKVSTLFMVFIIAMSIIGLAYTHWSDTVRIEGTVKMAHIKMTIISYKNLTSQEVQEYSTITSELSDDGHVLTLECTNLMPCWFIWIGLKTQNQGSLPANIKSLEYSFDDSEGFNYFEIAEYFYGPFEENEGPDNPIHKVWGGVKVGEELQEDGTVNFEIDSEYIQEPPFTVDTDEKVVIWIWIHVREDISDNAEDKTVTMFIEIVDDIGL